MANNIVIILLLMHTVMDVVFVANLHKATKLSRQNNQTSRCIGLNDSWDDMPPSLCSEQDSR